MRFDVKDEKEKTYLLTKKQFEESAEGANFEKDKTQKLKIINKENQQSFTNHYYYP